MPLAQPFIGPHCQYNMNSNVFVDSKYASWEGTKSEEKLKQILGHDKADSLMKKITRTRTIKTKSKSTLTYDQQNQVKDMFRESLTFD